MGKQSDSDFSRHRVATLEAPIPKTPSETRENCAVRRGAISRVLRSRNNTLAVARKEPLLAYALPSPYARNSLPSLAATGVANTLRRGCARKKL